MIEKFFSSSSFDLIKELVVENTISLSLQFNVSVWAAPDSKLEVMEWPPAPQLTAFHVSKVERQDNTSPSCNWRRQDTLSRNSLIKWSLSRNSSTQVKFTVLTLNSPKCGDYRHLYQLMWEASNVAESISISHYTARLLIKINSITKFEF